MEVNFGNAILGQLYTRSQGQCSTQIQAFLLGQKLKLAPNGFTLRVKAKIEKKNFNLPLKY
jgi:hypothetical protein